MPLYDNWFSGLIKIYRIRHSIKPYTIESRYWVNQFQWRHFIHKIILITSVPHEIYDVWHMWQRSIEYHLYHMQANLHQYLKQLIKFDICGGGTSDMIYITYSNFIVVTIKYFFAGDDAWWGHQMETIPVLLFDRWNPRAKASDAELWYFLWSA